MFRFLHGDIGSNNLQHHWFTKIISLFEDLTESEFWLETLPNYKPRNWKAKASL